jgi:hypothetical protein
LPANLPAIPAGLDHNPGATGQAFNTKHPYFANTKLKTLQNIAQYASYGVEYNKEYFDVKTGGYVVVHSKADKDDLKENQKVARVLAKHSYKAEIAKHTQNDNEQPEFVINGNKSDLKTPETTEDEKIIYNAIKRAREKQNLNECIVLLTKEKYNPINLFEGLKRGFRNKKKFKKAIIVKDSRAITIIRSDVKNNEAIKKLYRLTK